MKRNASDRGEDATSTKDDDGAIVFIKEEECDSDVEVQVLMARKEDDAPKKRQRVAAAPRIQDEGLCNDQSIHSAHPQYSTSKLLSPSDTINSIAISGRLHSSSRAPPPSPRATRLRAAERPVSHHEPSAIGAEALGAFTASLTASGQTEMMNSISAEQRMVVYRRWLRFHKLEAYRTFEKQLPPLDEEAEALVQSPAAHAEADVPRPPLSVATASPTLPKSRLAFTAEEDGRLMGLAPSDGLVRWKSVDMSAWPGRTVEQLRHRRQVLIRNERTAAAGNPVVLADSSDAASPRPEDPPLTSGRKSPPPQGPSVLESSTTSEKEDKTTSPSHLNGQPDQASGSPKADEHPLVAPGFSDYRQGQPWTEEENQEIVSVFMTSGSSNYHKRVQDVARKLRRAPGEIMDRHRHLLERQARAEDKLRQARSAGSGTAPALPSSTPAPATSIPTSSSSAPHPYYPPTRSAPRSAPSQDRNPRPKSATHSPVDAKPSSTAPARASRPSAPASNSPHQRPRSSQSIPMQMVYPPSMSYPAPPGSMERERALEMRVQELETAIRYERDKRRFNHVAMLELLGEYEIKSSSFFATFRGYLERGM